MSTNHSTLQKFLNISPEHINSGATLRVTYMGSEPDEFCEAFQGYTVPKSGHASISIPAAQYLAEELDKSIYSIQTLLSPDAPNHIDRTKLETYLSEEDFGGVFQMAREDYFSLPPWKRNHLKRSAGLF